MADGTKIEWTDATWNPITGCSVHSAGCKHCYAMLLAGTRLAGHPSRAGLTVDTKAGPVWTGEVRFNDGSNGTPSWLFQPLEWSRARRIFVVAHGDLFHESVPDEWIDQVFAVMALSTQHQFQVLTKRADRMRQYMDSIYNGDGERLRGWRSAIIEGTAQKIYHARTGDERVDEWLAVHLPLPNVWLGVSVEDQKAADERLLHLLATPAAKRWISAEPLLGPVDLGPAIRRASSSIEYFQRVGPDGIGTSEIVDWVVAGGESGPGARPMHPDWVRGLRDQCAAVAVPFLFKQWGQYLPCVTDHDGERLVVYDDGADSPAFQSDRRHPLITAHGREFWGVGKKAAGRLLDGVQHDGYPA